MKTNHTSVGNPKPEVVKNPTPANRRMNAPLEVSKTPSPANKKYNQYPTVKCH